MEERALVRTRSILVKDMTRFKPRIKSFLYFFGIRYSERFNKSGSHWSKNFTRCKDSISDKETQLQRLDEAIDKATAAYRIEIDLLQTIPGVGKDSAINIVSEIGV